MYTRKYASGYQKLKKKKEEEEEEEKNIKNGLNLRDEL
jgi:hypothetical protein